ncbi:alpha/beta fold hydrolase [Sphingomonas abietis]|uniref:Alpha/beta hydrolase n=1 Tax=Sphingomonas abietis TaxID=3012344 RepID=A0ABY7NTV9_9SPHN|nr:alpha/beta hydrolase [Sphingomonas abietis]WBO23881.1 alpha/beta hydrolase [Sphingomonas abietis]
MALAAGALMLGPTVFALRARSHVPQDGELVEIEGRRLHVRDWGQGPPIVMIHGLGGQMRNFSYALTDRLQDRHRIILIDRPGAGYSQAARDGSELRVQARIIAQAIRTLGIVRPLIVGHSLGGAVALAIALDNPGIAGGLALIAPLTQTPDVPAWLASPPLRSRWAHRLLARATPPLLLALQGAGFAQRAFAPEVMPGNFTIEGGGELTLAPDTLAAALGDAAGLTDELPSLVTRYGNLNVPVDILFGDRDAILDPALHGRCTAEQMPGARLLIVSGGHMLPVTQPDLVAAWLSEAQARIIPHHA